MSSFDKYHSDSDSDSELNVPIRSSTEETRYSARYQKTKNDDVLSDASNKQDAEIAFFSKDGIVLHRSRKYTILEYY